MQRNCSTGTEADKPTTDKQASDESNMNKDTPAVLDQKKAVQVEYKQQNAIQQRKQTRESDKKVKQQNTDQRKKSTLNAIQREKQTAEYRSKERNQPSECHSKE
jgi:hypothetical protein